MTIETNQSRVDYAGNGSPGPFAIPFPFYANTDLIVTLVNTLQQPKLLSLGYDYAVAGAGDSQGGNLTLTLPLATGELLFIVRETSFDQSARYREQGPFSARTTERAFDRAAARDIDRNRIQARSLHLPELNRDILSTEIQNAGASKVLQFTPDGRGIRAIYPRDLLLDQNGGAINVYINVLNHGFLPGQLLSLNGPNFVLASSLNPQAAELVGCVSKVIDLDNFILTTTGQVNCFTNLSPGQTYFLSQSPGALSLSDNSSPGQISKPVLIAQTATSGFLVNYRGKINPDSDAGGIPSPMDSVINDTITYPKHNLSAGTFLAQGVPTIANPSGLVPALADGSYLSNVVACITVVLDLNTFKVATSGRLSCFTNLNAGTVYYLANNQGAPGSVTATAPSAPGALSRAILIAQSATNGYFVNYTQSMSGGSPIPSSGNSETVMMTAHNFSIGQWLAQVAPTYSNPQGLVLALADGSDLGEVVGCVSEVLDPNNFVMTTGGKLTGLSGLTGGVCYYLSPTAAGTITSVETTLPGTLQKPLLISNSATSGFFVNYRGNLVPAINDTPASLPPVQQVNGTATPSTGDLLVTYTNVNGVNQITCPTAIGVGQYFIVAGFNGAGWVILQQAGQQISLLNTSTTVGTMGYVSSTTNQDSVTVLCTTLDANGLGKQFVITSVVGNIDIV